MAENSVRAVDQLSLLELVSEDINLNVWTLAFGAKEQGIELIVVTRSLLPTPQGAMEIPAKAYHIPIPTKDALGQIIASLQKIHEEMPDDPKQTDLLVANSMAGVESLAKDLGKLK